MIRLHARRALMKPILQTHSLILLASRIATSVTDRVKSGGRRLCLPDWRRFAKPNRHGGLLPRRAIIVFGLFTQSDERVDSSLGADERRSLIFPVTNPE
jgi:hypothetical protein